jgi:kynurenine formamidase
MGRVLHGNDGSKAEFNGIDEARTILEADFVDLSHEIMDTPPCTLLPTAENCIGHATRHGESVGVLFKTSYLRHLYLNYGTHLDFPGHLEQIKGTPPVGGFPLKTFVGESVVVDLRSKVRAVSRFFDASGNLDFETVGQGDEAVKQLLGIFDTLRIGIDEFKDLVDERSLKDKVLLFCTGLSKYWRYRVFNGWQYAYFINPHIDQELATYLVDSGIRLVGIDALQIEDPVINLDGNEFLKMVSPCYKRAVEERISTVSKNLIHEIFLDNGILIAENLTNLSRLVRRDSIFFGVPLRIGIKECTDNCVIRAWAAVFPKPKCQVQKG